MEFKKENNSEYQKGFFRNRSDYLQTNTKIGIPGDVPFHRFLEDYCVDAVINLIPSHKYTENLPLFDVLFFLHGKPQIWTIHKADIWHITFSDSGEKNYKGGKYINIHPEEVDNLGRLKIDFNLSANLLCAYSHNFQCGIPDNKVDFAINAGEIYVPEWNNREPTKKDL